MHKDIKAHAERINARLLTISKDEARELLAFHFERVRDFQHERLIHLLVTLFFGALLVASVILLFLVAPASIFSLLLYIVTALLLGTELCYIGYYYLLENGVQRLYKLTEKLRDAAGA